MQLVLLGNLSHCSLLQGTCPYWWPITFEFRFFGAADLCRVLCGPCHPHDYFLLPCHAHMFVPPSPPLPHKFPPPTTHRGDSSSTRRLHLDSTTHGKRTEYQLRNQETSARMETKDIRVTCDMNFRAANGGRQSRKCSGSYQGFKSRETQI